MPEHREHERIVPVIEERAVVHKQQREGDSVHVRKVDRGRDEIIRTRVAREHVNVQRVPIGAEVSGPVQPWHDGDTLVIPVMEQVVRLQWVVREEIRISRSIRHEELEQPVHLVREEAVIERNGPGREDNKHERSRT